MAAIPSYVRKLKGAQKYKSFRQFGSELKSMAKDLDSFQKKALTETGRYLVTQIKNRYGVHQAGWAPTKTDHPDTPLYDTGALRKSVKFQVVLDTVRIYTDEEKLAIIHEFGTANAGRNRNTVIPARPIWRPVYEKEIPRIVLELNSYISSIIS